MPHSQSTYKGNIRCRIREDKIIKKSIIKRTGYFCLLPYLPQTEGIAVPHVVCIFAGSETQVYPSHREGR
jgi:hypothetical protein